MIYRTIDGDMLDLICTKHYADAPYNIMQVLEANPGLAAMGPVLPAGVQINLPAFEADAPTTPTLRLWGNAQ